MSNNVAEPLPQLTPDQIAAACILSRHIVYGDESSPVNTVLIDPRTHCRTCSADIPAGRAGRDCKSCRGLGKVNL